MRFSIQALPLLVLLSLAAPAEPYPSNPYDLTRPGSYHEYKVLPKGTKYRDEILENLALPHGRKGFRSRYIDAEGKTDSIYEITPQGDLLRLKAIKSNGVVHFKPPVLGLPNLDKTKKWSSTSSATFYAPEYPKGYALKTADRSGRVVGSETVTVPAGTFRCLKVETVIVGLPCTEWYARGVGMVKMKAGPEEYLLLRYRTK